MRVAQWAVDWKEEFKMKDLTRLSKLVGGQQLMYDYQQDCVDVKVVYLSSHPLTNQQLDRLWEAGDLWCDDLMVARNFSGLVRKLRAASVRWSKEQQ